MADHGRQTSHRGLTWDRHYRMYRVRIYYKGKQRHVGRYPDEEGAARAYDKAALYLHGEAAQTNFGLEAAALDDTPVSQYIVPLKEEFQEDQAPKQAGAPVGEEGQGRKRRPLNERPQSHMEEDINPSKKRAVLSTAAISSYTPWQETAVAGGCAADMPDGSTADSGSSISISMSFQPRSAGTPGMLTQGSVTFAEDDVFDLVLAQLYGEWANDCPPPPSMTLPAPSAPGSQQGVPPAAGPRGLALNMACLPPPTMYMQQQERGQRLLPSPPQQPYLPYQGQQLLQNHCQRLKQQEHMELFMARPDVPCASKAQHMSSQQHQVGCGPLGDLAQLPLHTAPWQGQKGWGSLPSGREEPLQVLPPPGQLAMAAQPVYPLC